MMSEFEDWDERQAMWDRLRRSEPKPGMQEYFDWQTECEKYYMPSRDDDLPERL